MIVLTVATMILVMGGCNTQNSTHPAPTAPNSGLSQSDGSEADKVKDVYFEEIADESILPQDLQDAILQYQAEKGYKLFNAKKEEGYVLVTAGEKRTGGYGITIVSVQNVGDTTKIFVEETSPREDDVVMMVITYPYTVVKIAELNEVVTVYNKDGEVFVKHQ